MGQCSMEYIQLYPIANSCTKLYILRCVVMSLIVLLNVELAITTVFIAGAHSSDDLFCRLGTELKRLEYARPFVHGKILNP